MYIHSFTVPGRVCVCVPGQRDHHAADGAHHHQHVAHMQQGPQDTAHGAGEGSGFRVQGLAPGFRVQGLGLRFWVSGFRVSSIKLCVRG